MIKMKRLSLLFLLLFLTAYSFSQDGKDSLIITAKNSFTPQLIYFVTSGNHEYIGLGFEARYCRKLTNGVYLNAFYDYIAFTPTTSGFYGVPFDANEETTSKTNKFALGFLFKLKASKKAYALVSPNLFGAHTIFGTGYDETLMGFNFALGEEFFFSKDLSFFVLEGADFYLPNENRVSEGRFLLSLGLNFHF